MDRVFLSTLLILLKRVFHFNQKILKNQDWTNIIKIAIVGMAYGVTFYNFVCLISERIAIMLGLKCLKWTETFF